MAEDSSQASAIGGPPGGQIVTPAQQNPGLDSQFSKYIRSFYQAQPNIKGADRQLARICGDKGITTYFRSMSICNLLFNEYKQTYDVRGNQKKL